MSENVEITWHEHTVSREDREHIKQHRGAVLWFTGLSGSGKSTVANCVDKQLNEAGVHSILLDGDNIRHGLNASPKHLESFGDEYAARFGLGFSNQDRQENIRRIGAVSQLFCSSGIITLTAFVSPYRRDRDAAREYVTSHGRDTDFVEIFVDAPLEVCEARDPKGLYKQARAGKIKNFTGIDDPFEAPLNPEITLRSANATPPELAQQVVQYLREHDFIQKEQH